MGSVAARRYLAGAVDWLDGVGSHDHLCSIYQTDAERNAVAVPFLRIGLGRGEKCIYLHGDGKSDDIVQALAADLPDIERFISNGALVVKSKDEAYLHNGRFDLERMLAFWQHESAAAKSQGYSAMRGAGETDWMPSSAPGVEHWLDYEARLTDAIARCDCLLLCQYNRTRYPPQLMLGIIQTHPLLFYDGVLHRNRYYTPAAELLPGVDAERAVQRWLRTLRDDGQTELALRRAEERIARHQIDMLYQQDRLRQADARNAEVLENMTDMFFAFDKDFRLDAIRKARAELAHVNRALTVAELTASIAHELNQPLAAVVANANACERWLAARPPDEAEAHAALRRIIRDANRAAEVIAHVRALLAGHEPDKSAMQPGEAITEAIALVDGDARQKQISLSTHIADDLPLIYADRVRIQQVLLNLLVNAMDALASTPQPRTLNVSARREGRQLSVRVSDSGPGIEAHNLARLFEPFFTTKAQGMGMGLAICRSIIEEHGGRIGALNNADGRGATFEFTLPAYTEVQ